MALTNLELKERQKNSLHELVELQWELKSLNPGANLKPLKKLINKLETTMEKEDVAYVHEKIKQLYEMN